MSRLSFDTNVIQSLSKKVGEINASNNIVTEAIKALNENTFKMSQTLQNTSEMLQRSSANNKDLSQSISTLTQKLAVQNASDNTSSVKKQPGSHNVQTTPTNFVSPCWPI
jgi:ABC-type transporter Mla subunit MlaD